MFNVCAIRVKDRPVVIDHSFGSDEGGPLCRAAESSRAVIGSALRFSSRWSVCASLSLGLAGRALREENRGVRLKQNGYAYNDGYQGSKVSARTGDCWRKKRSGVMDDSHRV